MKPFDGKTVLITGGTGSLGKTLVQRLISGEDGHPDRIIIFSRDEAKQHYMRLDLQQQISATEDLLYGNFQRKFKFIVGDVRDYESIAPIVCQADIVINAAALKQVPVCEYFPFEAVRTNIMGVENIVRAIRTHNAPVETVVGISTDKACKPVNVMGMTKAIQERIFIEANVRVPTTRFICVRYGNVLASRGSAIPHFRSQILHGGPVTLTTPEMTRFLLSLSEAVDVILAAIRGAAPGDTYIPQVPSATMQNVALALIGSRDIDITVTGIRPGEKIHEVLISEEDSYRTVEREGYYVIHSALPELGFGGHGRDIPPAQRCLKREYSSAQNVLDLDETIRLLQRHRLLLEDGVEIEEPAEVLR
ncbi:MAG: polysaccharide biosynthesis protein [Armatimonadota bacterium]